MSDDNEKNEKDDLTRIENLDEFFHNEDDDFSDLETYTPDAIASDGEDSSGSQTEEVPDLPSEFNEYHTQDDEEASSYNDVEDDFKSLAQENTAADIDLNDFNNQDNGFEDNGFEDNSFEDNGFENNSFEDNGFENNSFEDNSFEDNGFEDNSFEESSEDNSFEESSEDNGFEDNSFEENYEENETANENQIDPIQDVQGVNEEFSGITDDSSIEQVTQVEDKETIQAQSVETKEIEKSHNEQSYAPPENFKDLQKFSQNISYGNLAAEGNPPFSVIIKDVKFTEDVEDIIILLKEFKIIDEQTQSSMRQSLERGSAIIPRISEYASITLCHKLRRFNITLLMGLSDEIHPSKSYSSNDVGLISKANLFGNKSHNFDLKARVVELDEIITSTTPTLEGMEIHKYLGVATERTVIDMAYFKSDISLESQLINEIQGPQKEQIVDNKIVSQNTQASTSRLVDSSNIIAVEKSNDEDTSKTVHNGASLADIYQTLIDKLKAHALKFQGNAVVGINFIVTPILISDSNSIDSKYQITCTGSVVWANKK